MIQKIFCDFIIIQNTVCYKDLFNLLFCSLFTLYIFCKSLTIIYSTAFSELEDIPNLLK